MQVSQLLGGSVDVKMLSLLPAQLSRPAALCCQLELKFMKTELALETWMEAICGDGIKWQVYPSRVYGLLPYKGFAFQ